MTLVTARVGHQIGHLATRFLPCEVGILEFRAAHVCSEDGEKHRDEGVVQSFEACERSRRIHSVPFPRLGILGAVCFVISYFIVLLLFR